jgi:hypothetical protein
LKEFKKSSFFDEQPWYIPGLRVRFFTTVASLKKEQPHTKEDRMFRNGLRSVTAAAIPVLFCAMTVFKPAQADAGGFILITYGDDISKVADIPAAQMEGVKQMTGAANPAIGYKYNQFGVFYLNIWTWGGDFVLYENDTYWDLGAAQAAQILGIAPDQLKKPLTYKIPPGLVLILILVIGGVVWKFILAPKFGGGSGGGSSLMDMAKAKAAAAAAAAGVGGGAGSKSDDDDDDDDDEKK